MEIHIDLENTGIPEGGIVAKRKQAQDMLAKLWCGESEEKTFLDIGWVDYPNKLTKKEIDGINALAEQARANSDAILVLGAGGSYMGAKAVIDIMPCCNDLKMYFLGYDFSERRYNAVIEEIKDKNYSLCICSKSGATIEPLAMFSIMNSHMIEKYGAEEAARRTYVITEDNSSALLDFALEFGANIMYIPSDIGGRYSVFTPVGLFPLALKGIDIAEFIDGAQSISSKDAFVGSGLDYAICRNTLGESKALEAFEFFDPYAEYLGYWLQQLFAESEGKEGKGVFPVVLIFNRDLHSLEQFLHDGRPCFFETMISLGKQEGETEIPKDCLIPALSNMSLGEMTSSVGEGIYEAHKKVGNPLIRISIEKCDAFSVGQLLYYFMIQCAVSALLLGVNPFNQPGVKAYKSEIQEWIKRQ